MGVHTPLKITFGGSFLPSAATANVTVKLLFSAPHDFTGTVQLPLNSRVRLEKPSAHRLRLSSHGLLLESPSSRATSGDRSSQVATPKLWNALPHKIHSTFEINTFKGHLKTYLFSNAFYSIRSCLFPSFNYMPYILFYIVQLLLIFFTI